MKNHFSLSLAVLLTLFGISDIQPVCAVVNHFAIGFIQFTYDGENEDPFIIIPLGNGNNTIPCFATVYDNYVVEINFTQQVGTADAEVYDDDMIVGIGHKSSTNSILTIQLPQTPGEYTIYVYLQDGTTFKGEYTIE